ncbi:hypothetical protein ACLGIH_07960 [Streptomyces sp. HMX87]|uniref:hypothetical protein n=1 Tax=Streptomyces sp. HMX87 TaxID=3390849 RepID=UPI003A86DC82
MSRPSGPRPRDEGRGPAPAHAVRLRRLDRWQTETLREDLADLYVESSRARPGAEYRGREEFLRRLTAAVRRPGFALLIAEDTAFAGCAYGFPVGRDGTWWRGFEGTLPQGVGQLTASGHVFAVTETLVHPYTEQQDAVARRLQERLLADHHASLGATLVSEADPVALDAFRSRGWQDVGRVLRSPDPSALRPPAPVPLRALILDLGPRTAARPHGLAHENRTQRHR